MSVLSSETVSAGCVAIGGRGVLIEARSDDARTDLLLRLIDRGGALVSDARTICRRDGAALIAAPLAGAGGTIEIRGIGAVARPFEAEAPAALLLVVLDGGPRLPEERRVRRIAGVDIPVFALAALDPAGPIKAELALAAIDR